MRRRQHNLDSVRRWHICVERWSNNCFNNSKCSEHLYGNGNEQWLYEHGTIYGDNNNDNGLNQWSHDDVRWRQHDIDGLRRWHICLERRRNNGLNNGKFSEHLHGNGNEQWLYEHGTINHYGFNNHSRRKRNPNDVWTKQWLHQRDSKYRIDLCMDRRFKWTKSIECRPRNLYSNSNRNGIGLYNQH